LRVSSAHEVPPVNFQRGEFFNGGTPVAANEAIRWSV